MVPFWKNTLGDYVESCRDPHHRTRSRETRYNRFFEEFDHIVAKALSSWNILKKHLTIYYLFYFISKSVNILFYISFELCRLIYLHPPHESWECLFETRSYTTVHLFEIFLAFGRPWHNDGDVTPLYCNINTWVLFTLVGNSLSLIPRVSRCINTDDALTCNVMKAPSSPWRLFGRKKGLSKIRDGRPKLLQKNRREQTCTVIEVPSSSPENNNNSGGELLLWVVSNSPPPPNTPPLPSRSRCSEQQLRKM